MSEPRFDWDHHFATASFKDVAANSPNVSLDRPPSLYSPNGKLYYMSSIDLAVGTHDGEKIQLMLNRVLESHAEYRKSKDIKRQLRARLDCIELCGLLSNRSVDTGAYLDPDALLDAEPTPA